MDQLVGSTCVACQQTITNMLEAENCRECGNAIHTRCIRPMEAGDGVEICHRCGYTSGGALDPVRQPEQQQAGNNMALIVIGTIVSIIGVVLLIGNISGLFRTFPFAGFIVLMIGGAIAGAGRKR